MKIFNLICLFLFQISLFAYENSMLNLTTPSALEDYQMEVAIKHRFYGEMFDKPLDNFFGMDEGANFSILARYHIAANFESKITYVRAKQEKLISLSYNYLPKDFPVNGIFELAYQNFNEPSINKKGRANFIYTIGFQNKPLFEMMAGTVNVGYDGYYQRMMLGLGLSFQISEKLAILGEYFPVLDRNTNKEQLKKYIGSDDAMAFGIKLDTYGHHFKFLLSNSNDLALNRVSLGVPKNSKWKFGFNLERIIYF